MRREELVKKFLISERFIDETDYEFLFNFKTFKETILKYKDKQLKYVDVGKMWKVEWALAEVENNICRIRSQRVTNDQIVNKINELTNYCPDMNELNAKIKKQKEELKNGTFTYLMYDGKYYKIGKSKNPERRLKQIQTGNPSCKLISYSNKITEFELHILYYNSNVGKEWFDLNEKDDVQDVIDLIEKGRKKKGRRTYTGEINLKNGAHKFKEPASTSDKILISYRKMKADKRKEATDKRNSKPIDISDYIIPFGKYKGKKIIEMVSDEEIKYVKWFVDTKESKNELDKSYKVFKQHINLL